MEECKGLIFIWSPGLTNVLSLRLFPTSGSRIAFGYVHPWGCGTAWEVRVGTGIWHKFFSLSVCCILHFCFIYRSSEIYIQ